MIRNLQKAAREYPVRKRSRFSGKARETPVFLENEPKTEEQEKGRPDPRKDPACLDSF